MTALAAAAESDGSAAALLCTPVTSHVDQRGRRLGLGPPLSDSDCRRRCARRTAAATEAEPPPSAVEAREREDLPPSNRIGAAQQRERPPPRCRNISAAAAAASHCARLRLRVRLASSDMQRVTKRPSVVSPPSFSSGAVWPGPVRCPPAAAHSAAPATATTGHGHSDYCCASMHTRTATEPQSTCCRQVRRSTGGQRGCSAVGERRVPTGGRRARRVDFGTAARSQSAHCFDAISGTVRSAAFSVQPSPPFNVHCVGLGLHWNPRSRASECKHGRRWPLSAITRTRTDVPCSGDCSSGACGVSLCAHSADAAGRSRRQLAVADDAISEMSVLTGLRRASGSASIRRFVAAQPSSSAHVDRCGGINKRRVSSHLHIWHLYVWLLVMCSHSFRTLDPHFRPLDQPLISSRSGTVTMSVNVESAHEHTASSEKSSVAWTLIVAVSVLAGSVAAVRALAGSRGARLQHRVISSCSFLTFVHRHALCLWWPHQCTFNM